MLLTRKSVMYVKFISNLKLCSAHTITHGQRLVICVARNVIMGLVESSGLWVSVADCLESEISSVSMLIPIIQSNLYITSVGQLLLRGFMRHFSWFHQFLTSTNIRARIVWSQPTISSRTSYYDDIVAKNWHDNIVALRYRDLKLHHLAAPVHGPAMR